MQTQRVCTHGQCNTCLLDHKALTNHGLQALQNCASILLQKGAFAQQNTASNDLAPNVHMLCSTKQLFRQHLDSNEASEQNGPKALVDLCMYIFLVPDESLQQEARKICWIS